MDCSPPVSSVHGILQGRILEWVAIPFSRGSSQLRDRTQVSHTAGRGFTIWATRDALGILSKYRSGEFSQGSAPLCTHSFLLCHWVALQTAGPPSWGVCVPSTVHFQQPTYSKGIRLAHGSSSDPLYGRKRQFCIPLCFQQGLFSRWEFNKNRIPL